MAEREAHRTRFTTDHDTIREWVEARDGSPAQVKDTGDGSPGVLRIDFPGYSGKDSLQRIPWTRWLEKFDEERLAFLYQDETKDGETSHFNKLVDRDSVKDGLAQEARSGGSGRKGRTSFREVGADDHGTQYTVDHDRIRGWAEARDGTPAQVKDSGDGSTGILRIDFPGYSGKESLERISWDRWFRKFDEERLAFLYQEETKGGERSRFSKLVDRDSVEEELSEAR